MKTLSTIALAAIVAASLTSCNQKAALANKIEGTWTGTPERIADASAAYSTLVKTFEFNVSDSGESGTLVITALIDVENTIPGTSANVQPLAVSAAATATVTGQWEAVDDDEVIVTIDPSTLTINLDPSAVLLNYNTVDDTSSSDLTQLKPQAAAIVGRQVNAAVSSNIMGITKIDDIKVTKNILECEIGKADVTLRRP